MSRIARIRVLCFVILGIALFGLGAGTEVYEQMVSDGIRAVPPSAAPSETPPATRQTSAPARIAPRPAKTGATSPSARPVKPTPEAAPQPKDSQPAESHPSSPQSSAPSEAEPTGPQGIDVQINILNPSCIITSIVQICLPLNLALHAAVLQNGAPVEDVSCKVRWLVFQEGFSVLDQSSPCNENLSTGLVLQLGGSYRVVADVLTSSGEQAQNELGFHVAGNLLQNP